MLKNIKNIEIKKENKKLENKIEELMNIVYTTRDIIYRNQRKIRSNDNFFW